MELGLWMVEYRVDPNQAEEVNRRLMEHVVAAARQTPGYRGWLTVDLDDNLRRDIWLFDATEVKNAIAALGPIAGAQIVPLTGDPERILTGRVVLRDGGM